MEQFWHALWELTYTKFIYNLAISCLFAGLYGTNILCCIYKICICAYIPESLTSNSDSVIFTYYVNFQDNLNWPYLMAFWKLVKMYLPFACYLID